MFGPTSLPLPVTFAVARSPRIAGVVTLLWPDAVMTAVETPTLSGVTPLTEDVGCVAPARSRPFHCHWKVGSALVVAVVNVTVPPAGAAAVVGCCAMVGRPVGESTIVIVSVAVPGVVRYEFHARSVTLNVPLSVG